MTPLSLRPPLDWQSHFEGVAPALAALMRRQSLTAALMATGAAFAVDVRRQGRAQDLWADECLPAEAEAFYAREVHLLLDGVPVVWARSVCADDAAGWKQVLDCGVQPLGARLFGGGIRAARSPFAFARVPAGWLDGAEGSVWARRSVFAAGGEVLGLTECFLPALQGFFS
ncbi:MAG: chorismate lyase [Eikenella sp.]|nr:chorismate lyase [Eikenella sp.]